MLMFTLLVYYGKKVWNGNMHLLFWSHMWFIIWYEGERWIGQVLQKLKDEVEVRCLEKLLPLVENLRTFKLKSVTTFMKKFIEQVWSHHQNSWKVPTNGCIDLVLILVEKVIPAKSFASHLYNFLGQSIFVVRIISLLKIMLQKKFFCPLLDIF